MAVRDGMYNIQKKSQKIAEEFIYSLQKDAAKDQKDSQYLSDKDVSMLYNVAYGHWQAGKSDIAIGFFQLCLQARPKSFLYAEAVARCHFDCKEYLSAILMYSVAIEFGADKIINYLNIVKCYAKESNIYCAYHLSKVILEIYNDLSPEKKIKYIDQAYLSRMFFTVCADELIDRNLIDKKDHNYFNNSMPTIVPTQSTKLS